MRKIAVVPVYNEEATLPGVMDAVLAQVDLLVIIDDGSRDASQAAALAWITVSEISAGAAAEPQIKTPSLDVLTCQKSWLSIKPHLLRPTPKT